MRRAVRLYRSDLSLLMRWCQREALRVLTRTKIGIADCRRFGRTLRVLHSLRPDIFARIFEPHTRKNEP